MFINTPRRTALLFGVIAALSAAPAYSQYSSPVRITNTQAQAVPVKDQNNPAIQIVEHSQTVSFSGPNGIVSAPYIVPAGKRLVIEFYTFEVFVPSGEKVRAQLYANNIQFTLPMPGPVNYGVVGEDMVIAAGMTRIYANPLTSVTFIVGKTGFSSPQGLGTGTISFSGYLVDLN